ncbi:ABC transporter permease [Pseudovibrio exalbescens]|uniref:cell division protein FtsX n=1 Tax=Pseudovibrio exalbescens TaxID=197461 RepID=UPI0023670B4D|nr:ABC transporter permease [Pseudovibrio exalbescens]MDD7909476.1 ABC transporter permease [Pseudovibrio exalbescens]
MERREPSMSSEERPKRAAGPRPAKKGNVAAGVKAKMAQKLPKKGEGQGRRPKKARQAPIVPPQAVAGRALMLVVAIMSFLACLTVGFVTVVNDAATDWSNDLVRELTIQIRPVDGIDMLQQIDRTVALAQEFPGVGHVRALSDTETQELLQPWLGAGLDLEDLPVPRLIMVKVDQPELLDLGELKRTVEDQIRGSSLDDHRLWTQQLSSMANGAVVIGFGILVLVLASMILSVVFATRAAMSGNKEVVEVLHFVGAEDRFISAEFQRHFLVLGLKGGIVGGAIACLSFLLIEFLGNTSTEFGAAGQAQALLGTISVSLAGYIGVVLVVVLVAILTAVTSRIAVHSHLAGMD